MSALAAVPDTQVLSLRRAECQVLWTVVWAILFLLFVLIMLGFFDR